MKRFFLIFLVVVASVKITHSQNTEDCYTKYHREMNVAFNNGAYKTALGKYNLAKRCATLPRQNNLNFWLKKINECINCIDSAEIAYNEQNWEVALRYYSRIFELNSKDTFCNERIIEIKLRIEAEDALNSLNWQQAFVIHLELLNLFPTDTLFLKRKQEIECSLETELFEKQFKDSLNYATQCFFRGMYWESLRVFSYLNDLQFLQSDSLASISKICTKLTSDADSILVNTEKIIPETIKATQNKISGYQNLITICSNINGFNPFDTTYILLCDECEKETEILTKWLYALEANDSTAFQFFLDSIKHSSTNFAKLVEAKISEIQLSKSKQTLNHYKLFSFENEYNGFKVIIGLAAVSFLGELGNGDGLGTNYNLSLNNLGRGFCFGIQSPNFKHFYFKGQLSFYRIKGEDKNFNTPFRINRNLGFFSRASEVSTQIGLNLFRYQNNEKIDFFSVNLVGGVGIMSKTTFGYYNNIIYEFYKLTTQSIENYFFNKSTRKLIITYPLGFSFELKLSYAVSVSFNLEMRFTNNDYIDCVSESHYVDRQLVLNKFGEAEANLYDRRIISSANDVRGNPNDNDALFSYFFNLLFCIW